ncbi:hypothetical protein PGT21_003598 [Puccinia graminis f. sp. tritici]|uniref:Uncharacterized protein n=1 Tax=Puccinia graminis f. sp. tritici TaxID=56615 RepID=A0A5B0MDN8_PUCGR|nr:hypothetical protein PGTUg99_032842 [Puccinia graminis f. sp. tritici]KAA1090504.1 hypothetical protein PGT21_003598 [Puccinia graminis f. sp. tritici]
MNASSTANAILKRTLSTPVAFCAHYRPETGSSLAVTLGQSGERRNRLMGQAMGRIQLIKRLSLSLPASIPSSASEPTYSY